MRLLHFFILFLSLSIAVEAAQEILLYASFDGTTMAAGPFYVQPNVYARPFSRPNVTFDKGIRGQAAKLGAGPHGGRQVVYPVIPNLDRNRGTLLVWFRVDSDSINEKTGLAPISPNLLPEEGRSLNLSLVTSEWHQLVSVWDFPAHRHILYLDGKLLVESRMELPVEGKVIRFGHRFPCAIDELYIIDFPLSAGKVAGTYHKGQAGKTWLNGFRLPKRKRELYPLKSSRSDDPRPVLPQGVEWGLTGPDEDTISQLRQLYRLDGYWRVQPVLFPADPFPKATGWWYMPVPGQWKGQSAKLHDKNFAPIDGIPQRFKLADAAWLERAFVLPKTRKSKRYLLHFDGLECRGDGDYPSDIYFNGIFLGDMVGWESRSFEVTKAVRRKGLNLIQVMNGRSYWRTVEAGLTGRVWLEVCPNESALIDSPIFVKAAVAEKQLGVDFALARGGARKDLDLWAYIQDAEASLEGQWLGPAMVKDLGKGVGQAWFRWPGAAAWTADDPQLFRFTLQIRAGEDVIDESFPLRFGFRELAISGGSLLLNGRRLQLRGISDESNKHFRNDVIRRKKEVGFNAGRASSPSPAGADADLHISDEVGWYVLFHLDPPPADFLGGPNDMQARRYYAARIERLANHPSVIMWEMAGSGEIVQPEAHPLGAGAVFELDQSGAISAANNAFHQLDPTRPNLFTRGIGGDVRSAAFRSSPAIPLQTLDEWPLAWAQNPQEPLLVQTGPFQLDDFFTWQRKDKGRQPVVVEHAARHLGSASYRRYSTIDAMTLARPLKMNYSYWAKHPLYDALVAGTLRRLCTSWRAMGASYFLQPHQTSEWLFDIDRFEQTSKVLVRWNSPLMVFIAGPEDAFLSRDHAYFPGETIRKQAILINDSGKPFSGRVDILWMQGEQLLAATAKSQQSVVLVPGDIQAIPVEIIAPRMQDRTAIRLVVRVLPLSEKRIISDADALYDEMEFEIFPRFSLPAQLGPRKFLVIGAGGVLERILKSGDVPFDKLAANTDLSKYDLVLLERGAAQPDVIETLLRLGLPDALLNGLNLIFFEQPYQDVLGLRTESFDSRSVFIRSYDSPLLQGLTDRDFTDWRGATDLKPPYPNPFAEGEVTTEEGERPPRFWHWSSQGTVATLCYQKPQRGNFIVLLENGFDLLYTPLVEYRNGLGRILFCQLDVSSRYGIDPVATLLIQRMLVQYSERSVPAPRPAYFIGGEKGRKLLQKLVVSYHEFFSFDPEKTDIRRPLVIDLRGAEPLNSTEVLAVQGFIGRGGRLLQLGASNAKDAAWHPGEVRFQGKLVYRTEIPERMDLKQKLHASLLSGLGDSDFFWRTSLNILVPSKLPGRGMRLEPGALSVLPFGKGMGVFLQVTPDKFTDPWQRTKTWRILSSLLTNLGAYSHAGVIHSEGDKRSGPYLEEALDFDPEAYRWEER